jgi:hypothetical protein
MAAVGYFPATALVVRAPSVRSNVLTGCMMGEMLSLDDWAIGGRNGWMLMEKSGW